MANDFTHYPLVVDTASGSLLTADIYRIKKIRWVGATTAGHQAIIHDGDSNLFWESVCAGANYVEESDFTWDDSQRNVINGLRVPTLGSGKLEIYY